MGSAKKAVKKVSHVAEKAVKETIKDPAKKAYQGFIEEPVDAALDLTGQAVGEIAEGMAGDPPPPEDTSAQDELGRQQKEKRLSQESELAKRKALRKRGGKGRGSLLSGSALGVADSTLG